MRLTLVLGSRNASSWSFRPWLAMRQVGLAFEEVVIAFFRADTAARIARWSPSGKVPVLLVDERPVWDSLAICEFAAELAPQLWPAEQMARAHARSVCAEMHSGFADLRTFMPMDFIRRYDPPGRLLTGVARDISRIEAIWTDCRRRYGDEGPFLFGAFGVVDAMFAPVVSRFLTYAVELGPAAAAYVAEVQRLPAWAEWAAAAAAEVADSEEPPRSVIRPLRAVADETERPDAGMRGAADGATAIHLAAGATEAPSGEARMVRVAEIKPIGGGIHRRR